MLDDTFEEFCLTKRNIRLSDNPRSAVKEVATQYSWILLEFLGDNAYSEKQKNQLLDKLLAYAEDFAANIPDPEVFARRMCPPGSITGTHYTLNLFIGALCNEHRSYGFASGLGKRAGRFAEGLGKNIFHLSYNLRRYNQDFARGLGRHIEEFMRGMGRRTEEFAEGLGSNVIYFMDGIKAARTIKNLARGLGINAAGFATGLIKEASFGAFLKSLGDHRNEFLNDLGKKEKELFLAALPAREREMFLPAAVH